MVLALVCAAVQLALGSSLTASALTLGLYASHSHGHAVTLQADGSHVDLVLSHGERAVHDHDAAPTGHSHPAALSEADHVVHIVESDASGATSRRALLDPAPVLVISSALPVAPRRDWLRAPMITPRAQGVEQLRTIVLRI